MTASEYIEASDEVLIVRLIEENAYVCWRERAEHGLPGDPLDDIKAATLYVFHRWPGAFFSQQKTPIPDLNYEIHIPGQSPITFNSRVAHLEKKQRKTIWRLFFGPDKEQEFEQIKQLSSQYQLKAIECHPDKLRVLAEVGPEPWRDPNWHPFCFPTSALA